MTVPESPATRADGTAEDASVSRRIPVELAALLAALDVSRAITHAGMTEEGVLLRLRSSPRGCLATNLFMMVLEDHVSAAGFGLPRIEAPRHREAERKEAGAAGCRARWAHGGAVDVCEGCAWARGKR